MHQTHICALTEALDVIVLLKWRQNQWSRHRPQTRWFANPLEECPVLLGNWPPQLTPQRAITKRNTAFIPKVDKSSCPRSSYIVMRPRDHPSINITFLKQHTSYCHATTLNPHPINNNLSFWPVFLSVPLWMPKLGDSAGFFGFFFCKWFSAKVDFSIQEMLCTCTTGLQILVQKRRVREFGWRLHVKHLQYLLRVYRCLNCSFSCSFIYLLQGIWVSLPGQGNSSSSSKSSTTHC